jgi:hypothetical protein
LFAIQAIMLGEGQPNASDPMMGSPVYNRLSATRLIKRWSCFVQKGASEEMGRKVTNYEFSFKVLKTT